MIETRAILMRDRHIETTNQSRLSVNRGSGSTSPARDPKNKTGSLLTHQQITTREARYTTKMTSRSG